MSLKVVKTRKDHVCEVCKEIIEAGSQADYLKTREPSGEAEDNRFVQTGIRYVSAYRHHRPHPTCRNVEPYPHYNEFNLRGY